MQIGGCHCAPELRSASRTLASERASPLPLVTCQHTQTLTATPPQSSSNLKAPCSPLPLARLSLSLWVLPPPPRRGSNPRRLCCNASQRSFSSREVTRRTISKVSAHARHTRLSSRERLCDPSPRTWRHPSQPLCNRTLMRADICFCTYLPPFAILVDSLFSRARHSPRATYSVLPAGEVSGTPYDVLGPLDASPLTWTVNVPAVSSLRPLPSSLRWHTLTCQTLRLRRAPPSLWQFE